jgi:hypothetical protein
LASFYWTKSLLCNDVFIQGSCFFQSLHFCFVLQKDSVQIPSQLNLVPLQPSGRRDFLSECSNVQASSVWMTRTFRPDLPLCQEAPNYSGLRPSGRFSSTFGLHLVFDQLWDFFPKHGHGKTAATVQMIRIPVWTRSFVRQVVYSKSRRPDVSLHGSDARASCMEIVCIRSTVRMTDAMIRTHQALI